MCKVLDRTTTKHHSEGTFFPGKKPGQYRRVSDQLGGDSVPLEEQQGLSMKPRLSSYNNS
jgi:hypothetical protein